MTDFDMESLRLGPCATFPAQPTKTTGARTGIYQTRPGELFLRGPIPWLWVCLAGKASGKALHAAMALWFYGGLNRSRTIALNQSRLLDLGVTRDSARRGLRALERAGLVKVVRHPGRKPRVTILLSKLPRKRGARKGGSK